MTAPAPASKRPPRRRAVRPCAQHDRTDSAGPPTFARCGPARPVGSGQEHQREAAERDVDATVFDVEAHGVADSHCRLGEPERVQIV